MSVIGALICPIVNMPTKCLFFFKLFYSSHANPYILVDIGCELMSLKYSDLGLVRNV